jgi:hypothetical protein
MSFVSSQGISPTTSTGPNIFAIPKVVDVSGNALFSGNQFPHVRIVSPTLIGTLSFDNNPTIAHPISGSTVGDVYSIPAAANNMNLTMGTGGALAIQFGRAT